MDENIQIYVACLASYNAGILHGDWIELDEYMGEDDVFSEINDILKSSPILRAEEWAIHDFEFPYGIRISEGTSVEEVIGIVDGVSEHGEAFAHCYNYYDGDVDTALEVVEGCWHVSDKYDLLNEYIGGEDAYDKLPDIVKNCLDWEHVIRNIELESIFLNRDSTHDGFFWLRHD